MKELEAANKRIRALQRKNEVLQQQKQKREKEFEHVHELYESYQHDKSTMAALLEKADANAKAANERLQRLQDRYDELQQENQRLQDALKQQQDSVRRLITF